MLRNLCLLAFLGVLVQGCGNSTGTTNANSGTAAALPEYPTPMTANQQPIKFSGTVVADKNSGLQLGGSYEIDTLILATGNAGYENAGFNLSNFGYKVCSVIAEKTGKSLAPITTPALLGYEASGSVFTGLLSYKMGEVKYKEYESATLCQVRYRIATDSATNAITSGTFEVGSVLISDVPLARDSEGVVYKGTMGSNQIGAILRIDAVLTK
jgi:hypothetical protein